MKRFGQLLDSRICHWFCRLNGFLRLMDEIRPEEQPQLFTPERMAREGWTDYQ